MEEVTKPGVLTKPLQDFVTFKEVFLSTNQIPRPMENAPVLSNLVNVLGSILSDAPLRKKNVHRATNHSEMSIFSKVELEQVPVQIREDIDIAGNAPPAPPPPPRPPKPMFWRFPEAEFSNKGVK